MINNINWLSMSNRWVISWLVIDYWRRSMSNRWVIEAQKFCGLSITHRWHWLLIDACNWLLIDDPSITHRLLYCARKTLSLLSCTIFFVCDSFICVRRIFLCIWRSCWRCRDAKCWSQIQFFKFCFSSPNTFAATRWYRWVMDEIND